MTGNGRDQRYLSSDCVIVWTHENVAGYHLSVRLVRFIMNEQHDVLENRCRSRSDRKINGGDVTESVMRSPPTG